MLDDELGHLRDLNQCGNQCIDVPSAKCEGVYSVLREKKSVQLRMLSC